MGSRSAGRVIRTAGCEAQRPAARDHGQPRMEVPRVIATPPSALWKPRCVCPLRASGLGVAVDAFAFFGEPFGEAQRHDRWLRVHSIPF